MDWEDKAFGPELDGYVFQIINYLLVYYFYNAI